MKYKGIAHKATSGQYKGEYVLGKDSYPITKDGKLDCNRMRAANAYAQKNKNTRVLHGLEELENLCGFDFHIGL